MNNHGTEAPEDTLRILVIEDNEDVAESMKVILELYRYAVAVAYTGAQGLAVAATFHPDVVLCDISLPDGMLGYDVAVAMRSDPTLVDAHLIAMTGYGTEEDQQRALAAGFDRHLTKPIDVQMLKTWLAQWVPRRLLKQ
jgi:CheY-like chemotaxis protein